MKGSLCRLAETSFLWRDTAMRIRERFNPRAPCGARRGGKTASCGELIFQPTRPLRGATRRVVRGCKNQMHFNPRAPCGARLEARPAAGAAIANFNPRAPCGARRARIRGYFFPRNFNPRAPCGARRCDFGDKWGRHIFQPTRPLRGATAKVYKSLCTFLR